MTIRLDPWHLIRGINCSPEQAYIGVGKIFQAQKTSPSTTIFNLCGGCGNQTIDNYGTTCTIRLTAPILLCSQQNFHIVGQSSGAEADVDLTQIPFDCAAATCISDFCSFAESASRWLTVYRKGVSVWNIWDSVIDRYSARAQFQESGPSSFSFGELCDVTFTPTPANSISLISNHASGVQIETSTIHELEDKSWVTISGTQDYNGTYEINIIDTTKFWITATYVADEATGQINFKYDQFTF